MTTRFLWLLVPEPCERPFLGPDPLVLYEGPRAVFEQVTGATEQDVGLFTRKALKA